jgi:hypothetical protein
MQGWFGVSNGIAGLVTYDWTGLTIPTASYAWPSYSVDIVGSTGSPANNGQPTGSDGWHTNFEYNGSLATHGISDTQQRHTGKSSIHLDLYPYTPTLPSGADGVSNFRAEVALYPFHYLYPLKSELWLGWSYYSPTGMVDPVNEGAIHQLHASNSSPVIELWNYYPWWGNNLTVSIRTGAVSSPTTNYVFTTFALVANKWMDFVEHVIWDTDTTGRYELWATVDGVTSKIADYTGANTYSDPGDGNSPYGGTPKLGFYHYGWHSSSNTPADNSIAAGCTHLETYIGSVKMIYRPVGNYIGSAGYDLVKP